MLKRVAGAVSREKMDRRNTTYLVHWLCLGDVSVDGKECDQFGILWLPGYVPGKEDNAINSVYSSRWQKVYPAGGRTPHAWCNGGAQKMFWGRGK